MQPRLQSLKPRLQTPLTLRLHLPHNHLIVPPRLIHRNLPQQSHRHPIRQPHRTPRRIPPKQHTGKLRPLILQREILMPGRLPPQITHLPLHPHTPDLLLQKHPNPPRQFRHAHHRLFTITHHHPPSTLPPSSQPTLIPQTPHFPYVLPNNSQEDCFFALKRLQLLDVVSPRHFEALPRLPPVPPRRSRSSRCLRSNLVPRRRRR